MHATLKELITVQSFLAAHMYRQVMHVQHQIVYKIGDVLFE